MSKVTSTDTTTNRTADDMPVRKRATEQTTATKANKRRKKSKQNKQNQKCTDVALYDNLEKQPPTLLNVMVSHFDKRISDERVCESRCGEQIGICSDMESLRERLRSLPDVGDVGANDMRERLLDYLDNNEEEFYGDFDEYHDRTASDMASELIYLLYN